MHARRRHPAFFSRGQAGRQGIRKRRDRPSQQKALITRILEALEKILPSSRKLKHPASPREKKMNKHDRLGPVLICLAIVVAIAAMLAAGCTETSPQDPAASTGDTIGGGQPQASLADAGGTPAPALHTTVPAGSQASQNTGPLAIDPISDLETGNLLVVSGTTSLPEKTPVYLSWKYGTSGEEKVLANRPVLPGTDGINRFRFVFDTSGFLPGSYTMTVANGKKDVSASAQFSLAGTYRGTDTTLYYPGTAVVPASSGTPQITVMSPGDRQQGDIFLVSGTTNLPAGTLLFYRVYPAYFDDKTKTPAASSDGSLMDNTGGDTIVLKGTGADNRWSFAMDTGGFKKMEYIVNVSSVSEDFTKREVFGSAGFSIR
jgi:hypothetical protein